MTSTPLARERMPSVWVASTAIAAMSASQWLASPGVLYLVLAALATVTAAVALVASRKTFPAWRIASVLSLMATIVVLAPAQLRLIRLDRDWPSWQRDASSRGLAQLGTELDRAIQTVGDAASAGAEGPSLDAASARIQRATAAGYEAGVVVFDHDTVVGWSGQLRLPAASAPVGLDVIGSPFYLAVRVTKVNGPRRATALALVDASPPGDRIARSLADKVAASAGLGGFEFVRPDSAARPGTMRYATAGIPLFDVVPVAAEQGATRFGLLERTRLRAGLTLAIALFAFIIAAWRMSRSLTARLASLAVAMACTAIVPLNQYSNISRLFNATVYGTEAGAQFTSNAGDLAISSAIVLLAVILVVRRRAARVRRVPALAAVIVVAVLGPFLLRDLARGIRFPMSGVDSPLWLIWEIPLFLAAVSVLLAGASAGAALLGRNRGVPPVLAPVIAAIAAVLAPAVWEAPGRWPWWYVLIWIAGVAALALSRQTRTVVLSAATVAALGAVTLVWGRTARGRVELAENDLRSLDRADPFARILLERFGAVLSRSASPTSRQQLLQQFVRSDLAPAGYPTTLFVWSDSAGAVEPLYNVPFSVPADAMRSAVSEARATGAAAIVDATATPGRQLVLAAPGADGGITVVAVAPRSRLYPPYQFAQLYGLDPLTQADPPYTVRLLDVAADTASASVSWRREGDVLHGDLPVATGAGARLAHVEVDLRSLWALLQRGSLIVILDLAIVGVLWLVAVVADGRAGRWARARRYAWGRSYRARLSLTLFGFFAIPAATFALWSYQQISSHARQVRQILVSETLRRAASGGPPADWVQPESQRLRIPLLFYQRAELSLAGDPVIETLAPIGRLLNREVAERLSDRDNLTANRIEHIGDAQMLIGYRILTPSTGSGPQAVLAAPSAGEDYELDKRRRDLAVLVLFSTVVGALAAFGLSGIAARQLARPIGSLRGAALAIAAGERIPVLESQPTTEFRPVFAAFRRMAEDLNASRTALEEAQRRTAAVLRNVATGVIAVNRDGEVTLANPRAEALLGHPLSAGDPIGAHLPPAFASRVSEFLAGDAEDAEFEAEWEGRQFRGRLARLTRGGAVVTADDVTELARAQRVLAWGEMARQVAHEIKNPLTPIRLGVQHLRRARADSRVDFDKVLDQNVSRILTEIDRLDEIARAFSRYGSAPGEREKAEPTDVAAVVRDVVSLEQMGADDRVRWTLSGADSPATAFARADELREVMLNVLENARLAGARSVSVTIERADDGAVTIAVRDDGPGIPSDVLPRIFEPHFSTRTSGSGLGLPISRQLVDGWGGAMVVESAEGSGTTVRISLRGA